MSTPRVSAGLLIYRIKDGKLQVLLAHPGGPLFKKKDEGAWSIPKGEVEPGEDLLECAKREFEEETAISPAGPFIALTPVKQKGGKIVHVWAFEGDCDPNAVVSNTFTMEWPPRSGHPTNRTDTTASNTLSRGMQPLRGAGLIPIGDDWLVTHVKCQVFKF